MIERYSREEMSKIWELDSKFKYYLDVELAVCKAYNKLGQIPDEALNETWVANHTSLWDCDTIILTPAERNLLRKTTVASSRPRPSATVIASRFRVCVTLN